MRYTAKTLAARIDTINGWLESNGSTIRFECGGRNGYQAVDEYSVDSDGNRVGSGCNRNVGCGTPRECAEFAETAYSNEYRNVVARKLREELAKANTVLDKITVELGKR